MRIGRRALLEVLAILAFEGCSTSNPPPAACFTSEVIESNDEGIMIRAPPYYQQSIHDHLAFLRKITGNDKVNQLASISVFDPSHEGCDVHAVVQNEGDPTLEGRNGYLDGSDIYLTTADEFKRTILWPGRVHVPFSFATFGRIEGADMSSVLAHEFAHHVYGEAGIDPFDEWAERGLTPVLPFVDPVTEKDFEEYFVHTYDKMTAYHLFLSLDAKTYPPFHDFILPSVRNGEITVVRARTEVNKDLVLLLEDPILSKAHNGQARSLQEYGFFKSIDELQHDQLVPALHRQYRSMQDHANMVLDGLS